MKMKAISLHLCNCKQILREVQRATKRNRFLKHKKQIFEGGLDVVSLMLVIQETFRKSGGIPFLNKEIFVNQLGLIPLSFFNFVLAKITVTACLLYFAQAKQFLHQMHNSRPETHVFCALWQKHMRTLALWSNSSMSNAGNLHP
jgi:hypothetical protein